MRQFFGLTRHPEYRQGMRDMLAVAPGMAAWGLMTGVAMIKSGMSLFEAIAMTLLVYAGSSQLAAIPLIAAGAPVLVIWATAFCVNLRFVVFSAHLRAHLMHLPLLRRLFTGYTTTDLSYVIFTRRYASAPQSVAEQQAQVAYLLGGCTTNWLGWQGASLIGIALAHSVPPQWGLGFAGILSLLGVACSLITNRLRVVAACVAGAAAVLAFALPFKLNILVAIGLSVLLCVVLEKTQNLSKEAA